MERLSKFHPNSIQLQFPVFYEEKIGNISCRQMSEILSFPFLSWKGFTGTTYQFDIHVLDRELEKIKKHFPNVFVYPNTTAEEWFHRERYEPNHRCSVPWTRVNVEPNGDIVLCPDYNDMIIGNLHRDKFTDLWNGQQYRKFRQKIREEKGIAICPHCTYSFL